MVSKTALSFALVPSPNSKRVSSSSLFFCWGKMVSKTALSFALVPSPNSKRVSSSSPFFCWGKMLSKIAPSFAHVVTGTFSEFLACITVVFLFSWGEMVSKTALSFALVPSPNSSRVLSSFPFFSAGEKCSKNCSLLCARRYSYLLRMLSVYYCRLPFLLG